MTNLIVSALLAAIVVLTVECNIWYWSLSAEDRGEIEPW